MIVITTSNSTSVKPTARRRAPNARGKRVRNRKSPDMIPRAQEKEPKSNNHPRREEPSEPALQPSGSRGAKTQIPALCFHYYRRLPKCATRCTRFNTTRGAVVSGGNSPARAVIWSVEWVSSPCCGCCAGCSVGQSPGRSLRHASSNRPPVRSIAERATRSRNGRSCEAIAIA